MAGDQSGSGQDSTTGKAPFPINRVVVLLGPFIALVSGGLATWLVQHVPGLHLDHTTAAADITDGIVFVVGAAGTFAIHHKWLTGWQQWEKSLTDAAAMPMMDLTPDGNYEPGEFPAALAISPATTGGAGSNGGGGNGASAADPAYVAEIAPAGADQPEAASQAQYITPTFVQGQPVNDVLPDDAQELADAPGQDVTMAGVAGGNGRPDTAARPDAPGNEDD
jgi:hypothetical protein